MNDVAKEASILNPEKWIDNYADYLYSFAYNRVSDEDTAKDLVQDTFLSALKARSGFKGEASEKTWLVSILKRKIIDLYRKNAAHPQQSFEESEQYKIAYSHYFTETGFIKGEWNKSVGPKPWNGSDKTIDQKEFKHVLSACLGKLPKVWSSVFALKYLEEEESESICKELDITSSNYWVIIHRAKLQMRECLEKNWIKA
ncbi:MAG TPA: sigma-70 family RNA polymerase sigma factor [Bacteroidia bacterium]|nr:sigma-70 family RNA polymerase sigma factor [Bacteroidia bacterium]